MKIIETKLYQIDEHPNKSKVFEWINDNWHDLSQFHIGELIDTMKAIQKVIGGNLHYSISGVPDRGEYITWKGYDKKALQAINGEDCAISGICYEYDVIEALKNDNMNVLLTMAHDEHDHIYSDDALEDFCIGNEFYFTEDGKFYGGTL